MMRLDQLAQRLRAHTAAQGWDRYFSAPSPDSSPASGITQNPRRAATILGLMVAAIIAGGVYFFRAMLDFAAAVNANVTSIPGPYPNTLIIYVVIPAFLGLFFVTLDYFKARTGLLRLDSPPGIAAGVGLALVLYLLSGIPGALIKHRVNDFAAAHGYAKCSNQFDPAHAHVYALQSYVAVYGCPTWPAPQ